MSEEAKKKTLAVCLPLYDGKACWETWFRLRDEEIMLAMTDLPWQVRLIVKTGCSLVAHARNELVADAILLTNADAVLFVDADMGFDAGALIRMLAHDVDVIGLAVPRKKTPLMWNVRFHDESNVRTNARGLIDVASVGTGVMLIKRRVFDILADRLGPSYLYKSENGSDATVFFETQRATGEDVLFCHKWREAGGKVWVDPSIATQHIIAPSWSVKGCLADWLKEQQQEAA